MKSLFVKHNLFLLILMLYASVGYPQSKGKRIFDDSAIKISETGTNSIHSDFGPSLIQNSLYFTTFNDNLVEKSDIKLKNREFYDLYKVSVDKQGNTIGKRSPIEEFVTRFNDGPVSLCPQTGELFVTQNYTDKSVKHKPFQTVIHRLKIIIAKQINGKWEQVAVFPHNNPGYSVGHPAITESGDTLVFSSDKPGGYGETDLYYSIRKNGKWETPVNLGPKINTVGKEEFAFITDQHFDGQYLIFSSKGRTGNGGFDLYYTPFPSDYSEIGHFERPINSESDDFAMTIPTDSEFGYLTSNRPGTGNDDIYKFTFKRIVKQQLPPQKKFRDLYIFNRNSMLPIPEVGVETCDKLVYKTDNNGKIDSLPCLESNCEVKAAKFGYSAITKTLLACNTNTKEFTRDTIWMDVIVNVKIGLKNIYYDLDKWDILPESAKELDLLVSLMKENPEMKVKLGSHTDSRGTKTYNQRLSQLRAESAVNYVVMKGIVRERITATGYGESELLNKCADGVTCTPQEHRENRRTEIFIPGFGKGENIKQGKGDYSEVKREQKQGDNPAKGSKTEEEKSENNSVSDSITDKFYLILGSFKDKLQASKFSQKLKTEGYEAMILGESEPFRVGIGYKKFSEAKVALEKFKSNYKSAWIKNY